MNRHAGLFCFLAVAFATVSGCSSKPAANQSKQAAAVRDKIQGKAQIVLAEASVADNALNAGGPSVYLWDGVRRYRLYFYKPFEVEAEKEYIAEGVLAQKAIDEIGDPDQGKNGYPLASSCDRVVRMAWPGLAFDVSDGQASVLRARVKRYPARPVLLVTRIQPVTESETAVKAKKVADAEEKEAPEVTVDAAKQRELLIEGPAVQTAPLWAPAGGTVRCKLIIDEKGKVAELETGAQLCEAVPWESFRYQPRLQRGKPVRVKTEVEVRFEARK
jgi:hypothetical protein